MPRNDKTRGLFFGQTGDYRNAKLLSRKRNRVTLTPRDVFKPAAVVADVFIDVVRCSGADCRTGCHAAGHLRASRRALCRNPAGALPAKSFDGARFYQRQKAWLTIDSGAPVSAIAVNRRNHFRLKRISTKSNLPARIQINGAFNNVAIARELRLGGLTLIDEPVVTVDLGRSVVAARLVHEEQIDGIIGADILFPTQAVLDCQRQLLILKTDPDVLGVFLVSTGADCKLFPFK